MLSRTRHATTTPEDAYVITLPEAQMTQEQFDRWFQLRDLIATLKQEEYFLRQILVRTFFPDWKEGTNRFTFPWGGVLVAQFGYDRKVDEASLDALRPELRKGKIPVDDLFIPKPHLAVRVYRTLTDEQRVLVDQALDIKESSPQVKLLTDPKAIADAAADAGDEQVREEVEPAKPKRGRKPAPAKKAPAKRGRK